MSFFLNIIYVILLVFYVPALWFRGKLHKGYRQRLGHLPPEVRRHLGNQKHIWVHAVSVGEVLAIRYLIEKFQEHCPQYPIVCTTVTKTGYTLAKDLFKDQALVLYAPLDFSWIVRKFCALIDPAVYIAAETEWWPNLYGCLHKKGVPIFQVNGRISDKALKGYRKIPFLTKRMIRCVTKFFMQSEAQKKRILALGADSSQVEVLGNLKFDNLPDAEDVPPYNGTNAFWVGGSTHPGEEELLLETYGALKDTYPHLRLVLAPRHVERVPEVIRLIEQKGYRSILLSSWAKTDIRAEEIILVDTIGHLREVYAMAKIVFIGKTFKVGGGQNMLEPACFGVPTIAGPLTDNFKQVMEIFLEEGAIIQISDPAQLAEEVRDLLRNFVRYQSISSSARRVVRRYKGATTKTVQRIKEWMETGSRL